VPHVRDLPRRQGKSGSVLQTQKSEVVNDVHSEPRFYGKIDSKYGFVTQNLIAIPLTAGEEKIGVMDEWKKWKNIHRSFGYVFFGLGLILLALIVYAMMSRLNTHEPTTPPSITQSAVPGGKP